MGYLYESGGKVKVSLGGSFPESMQPTTVWTKADLEGPCKAFFASLAAARWTYGHITEIKPIHPSPDTLNVQQALKKAGVGSNAADTVANWLGGGFTYDIPSYVYAMYTPFFCGLWGLNPVTGVIKAKLVMDENVSLNPDYLIASGTNSNIGDALLVLKNHSPGLHAWVVMKGKARALKVIPADKANCYQPVEKAIAAALEVGAQTAASIGRTLANTAKGVGNAFDFIGFLTSNVVPIAVVGLGLWAFFRYKSMKRLGGSK